MAAGAEHEQTPPPAGLDAFAWLFGAAELLAPAPPAARDEDEAEAPPRAA